MTDNKAALDALDDFNTAIDWLNKEIKGAYEGYDKLKAGGLSEAENIFKSRLWHLENIHTLVQRNRTALQRPEVDVEYLCKDDEEQAIWQAIQDIKFGNKTDDKMIVSNLHEMGFCVVKSALLHKPRCKYHPDVIARESLDGDDLCQSCCDAWVKSEGTAQAVDVECPFCHASWTSNLLGNAQG
jgi:hypothetical protein